jgi:transcriptional regulator with XRE-family HTH domain
MIGDNIRNLMKVKKVTSKELAAAVGVTATHISYILNNKRDPSMDLLVSIADFLGVSVNDFFKEETAKPTDIELNKKDKKEIEDILKQTEQQLLSAEGLMFDGKPASPETVEKIINAMRIGMELAKKEAKEKYTPKKYRK